MNTQWNSATRYIIGAALFIFGLYLVYISRSIIYLLVTGALISLVLRPLILFFIRRLRFPRGLAVIVSHVLAGVMILLAPLVLVPPVIDAASLLFEIDYLNLYNDILGWSEATLLSISTHGLEILGVNILLNSLVDPLLAYLRGVSPTFQPELPSYTLFIDSLVSAFTVSYGLAISLVGTVVSGIVAFFFLILSSFYISLDGPRFYRSFLKLFPRSQRYEVATLNKRIRNTWDAFFRGQLALMFIIGITVWLGLTILGVPGAFALGIIAGLLEIIPNIGPVLAAIPAVVVVLIQGSSHFDVNHLVLALIVIGFYVLIQAFENYVVVPQVLGEAVELHPLIVLAGVLIGASVWGILGALLAVPLIASLKEVMEYSRRKVLGEDPFPPERVRRIDRRESLWESVRALVIRGRRLTQEKIKLPGVQKDSDVDESQEGEK